MAGSTLTVTENGAVTVALPQCSKVMVWSKEELVESIFDSIRRKEEYERKIAQELTYQENLYELLRQMLMKKELPQAFE
jgi:hypothetical protein